MALKAKIPKVLSDLVIEAYSFSTFWVKISKIDINGYFGQQREFF